MRLFLTFLLVLCLAAPACAAGFQGPTTGTSGQGGFQGPTSGTGVDTVAKALKARDDAPVVLTGNILSRMAGSDDKYMFRDATGDILVEIDHEVFAGRNVTPANTVRLSGEVDNDLLKPIKIDVKVMEILQ